MPAITIATFNINSIKARLPNLLTWLDANPVDILLLQELKCMDETFPAMELEDKGYNLAVHGQKTYNGVAICSKFPIDEVVRGLPEIPSPLRGEAGRGPNGTSEPSHGPLLTSPFEGEGQDLQARYIEAVVSLKGSALRVASAYVPNGQAVDSDKFPYKLKFYDRLRAHWQTVLGYNEVAVLGGDFNVAPAPLDVYDPKALDGSVCYHPQEREKLRGLMHLGLYDAFRVLHPDAQQFSWWDYRAGGYERNHGLRIDHLLLSGMAADKLTACRIDETPRQAERPSDHAPVIATFEV